MTVVEFNRRLHRVPFRPFRIRRSDGTSIPLRSPRMVLVCETLVIVPIEMGIDEQGYPIARRSRTIPLSTVVELRDLGRRINPPP